MNRSLRKKQFDVRPYNWGYFVGWMGTLLFGAISIVHLFAATQTHGGRADFFYGSALICIIASIAHFFIIKRNKWAWTIGIILQLNPVLWFINGIYVKTRWSEMNGIKPVSVSQKFDKASPNTRALIAGTAFWAIVALTFIFLFEPYGGYISNRDAWHIVTVISFPPAVISVGYMLYMKVIKQQGQVPR